MLQKLINYFYSDKLKSTALIFASSLFSAGFGFLAFIITSRALGPSPLGIITSITATISVINGFFELGLGASIVRFIPSLLIADKNKAVSIIKSSWYFRLGTGLFLSLAGIVITCFSKYQFIDVQIDKTLTVMAFVGVIFTNVDTLQISILQAYQEFKKVALSNGLMSFLRLCILALLFYGSWLSINNYAILSFLILPAVAFGFNYFISPSEYTKVKVKVEDTVSSVKYLFGYGKWIYSTSLLILLIQRVDILMLARWRGSHEVGIYAVAMQMAFILPMIMRSLNTVLIPHLSKGISRAQASNIFKKNAIIASIITLAAIPFIVYAKPLLYLLFGAKYNGSIVPFQILAINYLIQIFVNPYTTLQEVYAPHISTARFLIFLALFFTVNYFAIPAYGVVGAAWAVLICYLLSYLLPFWVVNKILKNMPK